MSAATKPIDTPERAGIVRRYPLAADVVIYAGTLVALDSAGRANPAADAASLRVVGRAEETVDNADGDAAALDINVKVGTFRFNNSGTAAVDADDVGKICFVEDDNTVAETGGTNSVVAGRVVAVDSAGVWVDTSPAIQSPVAVALTSTNGVAAAASADLAALAAEAEKIGDDVRAIKAALVTQGILK